MASSDHAALRAAFVAGTTRPIAHRRDQLEKLLRLLVESDRDICAAITSDLGRHETSAYTGDVYPAICQVKTALASLDQWAAPQAIGVPFYLLPGKAELVPEPKGVVLIISPFNYPCTLLFSPLAAALAAGNAAFLKPSEQAPATSKLLTRLVRHYLDPCTVRIQEGGVELSKALLELRWDHILYTGSPRIGRIVARAAAASLTPCTLELGGKSPVVVTADANIPLTARRLALAKITNGGQVGATSGFRAPGGSADRGASAPCGSHLRLAALTSGMTGVIRPRLRPCCSLPAHRPPGRCA